MSASGPSGPLVIGVPLIVESIDLIMVFSIEHSCSPKLMF